MVYVTSYMPPLAKGVYLLTFDVNSVSYEVVSARFVDETNEETRVFHLWYSPMSSQVKEDIDEFTEEFNWHSFPWEEPGHQGEPIEGPSIDINTFAEVSWSIVFDGTIWKFDSYIEEEINSAKELVKETIRANPYWREVIIDELKSALPNMGNGEPYDPEEKPGEPEEEE